MTSQPVRVSFPTTTPIITPLLSATPLPSIHPIILEKLDVTKNVNPFITAKSIAFASATGILLDLGSDDYGRGNKGEGGCSGDYWSRFYSLSGVCAAINNNEAPQQEWDSHDMPANITLQLNNLIENKKYMVYDISYFDLTSGETVSSDDYFFKLANIHPGGIYNKAELQEKLNDPETADLFDILGLELNTNFNGTISIKISFVQVIWNYSNKIRCISGGLLPRLKIVTNDEEMTLEEELESYRTNQKAYKRRIERSRPCLLPDSKQREIQEVLKKHGKVCGISLSEIRCRVDMWYRENGFTDAHVVTIFKLDTNAELVIEVAEGNIMRMEFQFQDKLGNVVDGDTNKIPLFLKELPKQFCEGQIYNEEYVKQAMENINYLRLYKKIGLELLRDDKSQGIIVRFLLIDPIYMPEVGLNGQQNLTNISQHCSRLRILANSIFKLFHQH